MCSELWGVEVLIVCSFQISLLPVCHTPFLLNGNSTTTTTTTTKAVEAARRMRGVAVVAFGDL